MKSVLIDPGIIPDSYFRQIIEDSEWQVTFIGSDERMRQYKLLFPTHSCNGYGSFRKERTLKHKTEVADNYNDIFARVISDYKTLQIAERCSTSLLPWDNSFSALMLISDLVSSYIDFIVDVNPEILFFQATPHEIQTWTMGKVAELMGVRVCTAITTALPWKSIISEGLGKPHLVYFDGLTESDKTEALVDDYICQNSASYDEAIPSYEKERLVARKGKFWSWKKEIRDNINSPKNFVGMFRKYNLFKYYQKNSITSIDTNKKYVVVFLHYQPERTSMPEGRYFTQQYNLIKTLRYGLPDDYSVYVKEHPSMFINHMDVRYRNKEFYDRVTSLPNVHLVNIGIDSFTLTDHSVAIATITGTVGIQSFIRGKSVFCFGDASYVDFDYCFKIYTAHDVKVALETIEKVDKKTISSAFEKYLHSVDAISINGTTTIAEVNDFYAEEYRLRSNGRALQELLKTRKD